MIQEKQKDLKSTQQKALIQELMQQLSAEHPSFYYLPTIELAGELRKAMDEPGRLSTEQLSLVEGLTQRDIQILLALH